MRRKMMAMGCVVLIGCGSSASPDSGSAPPGDAPPVNQGQTPSDNANNTPVIGGSAPSGVYVSSSLGSDTGTGSSINPFKKLADAIALAKQQNLPVNACAETYAEALTLTDGVSMFGYYDCKKGWARGTTNATIASPTSPALVAKSIMLPTRIAGFDVTAPDFDTMTSDAAASSIALSISDSQNLTFTSVTAHAGKGSQGVDGTAAVTNNVTFTAPVNGPTQSNPCGNPNALFRPLFCTNAMFKPGTGTTPGGTATCSVGDPGGAGGLGGAPRIYEQGSIPSNAVMPASEGTAGGGTAGGHGGNIVIDGAPGGVGAAGTDGANGQWLLGADGFTVGNGGAGAAGAVGGGGGGGGATTSFIGPDGNMSSQPNPTGYYDTAGGAGGGAGGCAGQAGTPGTGGGASIAALVTKSTVTFEQSRLESSAGGRAGKGALGTGGTAGQNGGAFATTLKIVGGTSTQIRIAGAGGAGAAGGRGGVSGHGAPGPSIALAYSGDHPTLTMTALAPGAAGDGQPELDGTATLPAVTGVSEAEHQFQ